MLPFLKNRDDGVGSGTVETKQREPDDDLDFLGAVARDMMSALKSGDEKRLKGALEAFCEHIQDLDYQQDQGEAP